METRDLFITPIYLLFFGLAAYLLRPYLTDKETRPYFLSALWLKFAGAIILGIIYQFYYKSGDTYGFFQYGSRWIWEAWLDDPIMAIKILLESGGDRHPETFEYTQHIWYYRDKHSFTIIRIVGFFDLFTFHTYSATALFFALFNFSGSWALFKAILKKYPYRIKQLAISIFFIPSIVFWGSGILKDTVTFGALMWMIAAAFQIIENRRSILLNITIILLGALLIYNIKVYVLLTFLPLVFTWGFWKQITGIRNIALRWILAPAMMTVYAAIIFVAVSSVSLGSEKYRLDRIAQTAAATSYDIRYGWGARSGGTGGYDLGVLDGTWQSMFRLFPQAVVVTLFRPFFWEVRNPLMLISAIEGFISLLFLLIWFKNKGWKKVSAHPFMIFCLGFVLVFAFAVGVSTYNFGSLARYKIPMLPLFWMFVFSICDPSAKQIDRKIGFLG